MQKLKIDDEVIVIAGKEKGKSGKITKIIWGSNKVVVEGLNKLKKTMRPTEKNPSGGFTEVLSGIDMSNVQIKSPKDGKPTRVKIDMKDGKKVRVAKRCGSPLP